MQGGVIISLSVKVSKESSGDVTLAVKDARVTKVHLLIGNVYLVKTHP